MRSPPPSPPPQQSSMLRLTVNICKVVSSTCIQQHFHTPPVLLECRSMQRCPTSLLVLQVNICTEMYAFVLFDVMSDPGRWWTRWWCVYVCVWGGGSVDFQHPLCHTLPVHHNNLSSYHPVCDERTNFVCQQLTQGVVDPPEASRVPG
jgi:hypothetical protein